VIDIDELSGGQKAAVLLVHLGKENAGKVLASMSEAEVEEIAAEIVKLGSLDPGVVDAVLGEFQDQMGGAAAGPGRGGVDFARDVLESSLGPVRADTLLERVSSSPGRIPFSFLREADPRQLQNFLAGEHPQTVALVLAHLRAEQASTVLSGLDPELSAEVAHRIALMDRTSPEMVRTVSEVLHRRTSSVLAAPVPESTVGGLQPLVEIINRADPGTEKLILEGLDALDQALAEEVRSRMFVFEDILGLEDRAVQTVLRQVETAMLAKALKGAPQPVADKVLGNVSERARENLVEEIELLGRVRLSEVEEARGGVVTVIRALEASGEIVLRRGSDEDEYVG
jgi:flagellar motor switch protein FliG